MRNLFKSTVFVSASVALTFVAGPGYGQTPLPQINVETTTKKPPKRTAARRAPTPPAPVTTPAQSAAQAQEAANRQVVQRTQALDQRRDSVLLPKIGANTYEMNQRDLDSIPQGSAIAISDLALQFPGVYQDSTSQGDFHVRNEHANVQYRINGILLPDGVSGFSQLLDTSFISSMRLITGALPAQYGLHTAGVIDITAKSGSALAGGEVGVYGGSHDTISPYMYYGGVVGQTEYFATGRFQSTGLGLENPTSAVEANHDISQQGRFFAYTSTLLDPQTRFVTITGMGQNRYQIPNNPGQSINAGGFNGAGGGPYSAFGVTDFNSANINQNQYEKNAYAVAAWQRSVGDVDAQFAYYSRYSDLHFVPDMVGDSLINNVASDVFRSSFLNGISGDVAYRLNDAHTLRGGFYTNAEYTQIRNTSTVEPLDPSDPTGLTALDQPFNILDANNKLGYQLGAYVQDEFRITDKLTFNYGLRFDQIFQYVDANQVSPRASVTYKPWWGTVLHAGYARNFTPPEQVLGRTVPTQLFEGTTSAAAVQNIGSIQPERSDVYDIGILQQVLPRCPEASTGSDRMPTKAPVAAPACPTLEIGASVYYKHAKDLIDDGQFGQAYTLTAFNYAYGENVGTELTARYRNGNFSFDTSWAVARQIATDVVSNQALFASVDDLAIDHWRHTDHDQLLTGSARAAYRWDKTYSLLDGTVLSATAIYGSGLRNGFDNSGHLPAYYQINLGASREFAPPAGWFINDRPVTVRFDVVNVTDNIYEIRDGSGVGVFAPQFGPRRGYFIGFSQKLGDVGPKAPMPTKAMPSYDWTGFYVGAHFGGAYTIEDATTAGVLAGPMTNGFDSSGALGGFQLGYNLQFMPHWLVGFEGEVSWSSAESKTNFTDGMTALAVTSDHNKGYETLTGRIGYIWGPLLTYAKAGSAWANIEYALTATGAVNGAANVNANRSGWTFGTGIEYKLSPRWSAKAEYSFLDFGTATVATNLMVPGDSFAVTNQIHEVKAGFNYHWRP